MQFLHITAAILVAILDLADDHVNSITKYGKEFLIRSMPPETVVDQNYLVVDMAEGDLNVDSIISRLLEGSDYLYPFFAPSPCLYKV